MIRTSVFPRRYVQGAGALHQLGPELKRLGSKVFALVDHFVADQITPYLDGLTDVSVVSHLFTGHCTHPIIENIAAIAKKSDATVLVAFGGGSVLDVGRSAASAAGMAFVSAPTIAASDAPCSGISIVYDENGVMSGRLTLRNPDLVIVDTALIAKAPVRFFAAGIGDGLATWYEADSCRRSHSGTISGVTGTALAHAAARLCRDTILERGRQAVNDCRAHLATPDLDAVVEATVLLSGIGFESGGLGAAHAIHNGLTMLPQTARYMHGEKVAFGLLASLFLSERAEEERRALFAFCRDVGLPVRLSQIACDAGDDEALTTVAAKACQPGSNIHNEPFPVTPDMVVTALKAADLFGAHYSAASPSE
ncbi:glycerol dehydrogenase [Telmatospirillum siberiense]|nr:glycerol dehydrogenase [Telmatospirillum siberiense]